jgi:hypothetical protein
VIAVLVASPECGRAGTAIGLVITLAFLAITVDVNLSPRLQRGNWRQLSKDLSASSRQRVITTVELGSAPLEYYLPGLHNARAGSTLTVDEIVETGYSPLREGAEDPPAPGFVLVKRLDVDGLIALRFHSSAPVAVSEASLRRRVITLAHPEVLVPAGVAAVR